MYNRIIFRILASLAIAACSSRVNPKFDQAKFDTGEYAYIVLSAKNNASSKNVVAKNEFTFEDENGERIELAFIGTQGAMIPAGDYVLTEYRLAGSNTVGNLTFSINLNFTDYIDGGFTAPAGKVIYLGNVETTITENKTGLFKRFFNMGTSADEVEFTTEVKDDFSAMTPEKKARFEKETGRALEKGKLNWSKK